MKTKGTVLFRIAFFFVSVIIPAVAPAQEWEDLGWTSACLDRIRPYNHKDSLGCIGRIEQYNDATANELKCDGRLMYGGLDFFRFPLLLDDTVQYPLTVALTHVADWDVDKDFAHRTREACHNSYSPSFPLMSDVLWLKAVFLDVSKLQGSILAVELAGLSDRAKIDEIDAALQTAISSCKTMPSGSVYVKSSFCLELLRIDAAPGRRFYDRLLYRLKIYG